MAPPSARNVAVSFAMPMGFMVGGGLIPLMVGVAGDMGSFGVGIAICGALIFVVYFVTMKLNIR